MDSDTRLQLSKVAAEAMEIIEMNPISVPVGENTKLPSLREILTERELAPFKPHLLPAPQHVPLEVGRRELPLPEKARLTRTFRRSLPSGRSRRRPPMLDMTRSSSSASRVPPSTAQQPVPPATSSRPTAQGANVNAGTNLSSDADSRYNPFFTAAKLAAQLILRSPAGQLCRREIIARAVAYYNTISPELRLSDEQWATRIRNELRRMDWLFERVILDANVVVWRVRPECRAGMMVEAFKQGNLQKRKVLI